MHMNGRLGLFSNFGERTESTPTLSASMPDPDFFQLLRVLEDRHVNYVVIGGIALLINGGGVVTSDIDLCISFDKGNLAALAESLNEFEPALRTGKRVHLDEQAFEGEFVTYFTSV